MFRMVGVRATDEQQNRHRSLLVLVQLLLIRPVLLDCFPGNMSLSLSLIDVQAQMTSAIAYVSLSVMCVRLDIEAPS